jgi:hypothetical protein
MKVYFNQVYLSPGIEFPFSIEFQCRLSEEITRLVTPSKMFIEKYGRSWDLIFYISAKRSIRDNRVRGPAVLRKRNELEYTVFLPFDVIKAKRQTPRTAMEFLIKGVCSIFDSLGIDTAKILEKQEVIIEQICSDPATFEAPSQDEG